MKKDDSHSRFSDLALLVFANALWGATDVVAKSALQELSPVILAWLRFTIALLPFLPVIIQRRNELPRTVKGWLPFFGLGATGFFLNFLLDYQGLRLAPASHAVTLRISEAMLIVVLSGLILRERVGARAGLGLVAGLIGTGLVLDVDFKNLNLFAAGYRLGDLLILAGAAVEALYTVIGKRVLVSARPLTATALACACGWLMLTMISLPQLPTLITHPPSPSAVLAAAYLGLFATSLGFAIWYRVLRRRESHRVGVTIMIQPVIGIPLAAIVFQESVKIGFLLGAALIALGVYLAMAKDMRLEA